MAPIPIDTVRHLAALHGYEEIDMNEMSRVVSFRKEGTRINVYYTTGTVATCVKHPHKGKTQLFRREQSPSDLDAIFKDPRTHTGVGYYCKNDQPGRAYWSPHGAGKVECDDAQRWRFVQAATGFCNPQQANQIAACCELWNKLRFAPGITSQQKYETFSPELQAQIQSMTHKFPCECGHCHHDRAGSMCSMGAVLWNVAFMTEDEQTLLNALIYFDESPCHAVPSDQVYDCDCYEGIEFRQTYGKELKKLERQLMSFPKGIRRELLYFFFKKLFHAYELVVRTEEKDINTFGAAYLSQEVAMAHWDYGEMMYNQDDPNHLCNCHGLS